MSSARFIAVLVICFWMTLPISGTQAADSDDKVIEQTPLNLEKDEMIQKLKAEVRRLNQELRELRLTFESKMSSLQAENQSLRQTLENIRNQVGGGGYAPTSM